MSYKQIEKQPRLGTKRRDASGRTWLKVRTLTTAAWRQAIPDANFAAKLSGVTGVGVTDAHVEAMGYQLETPDVP